jgi:zinc transporter ZupT
LTDQNDKQTVGGNIAGKQLMMRHRRRVIFSVVVTAIVAGVSLQNFPVGTAAFLGTTKGFRVGLNLALAIALHYIPEVIESTRLVNGTDYWYTSIVSSPIPMPSYNLSIAFGGCR